MLSELMELVQNRNQSCEVAYEPPVLRSGPQQSLLGGFQRFRSQGPPESDLLNQDLGEGGRGEGKEELEL